jgi:hypothetical protein
MESRIACCAEGRVRRSLSELGKYPKKHADDSGCRSNFRLGSSLSRRKAAAIEGGIAFLAIVVAAGVHEISHDVGLSLAVALFAEILLQILRFRFELGPFLSGLAEGFTVQEHPFQLLTDLSRRSMPLTLLAKRPQETIFQERFDELIAALQHDLEDLDQGHFVVPMHDVQDVSFDVCKSLEKSAFCTAPQGNLEIFMTSRGQELKKANFDAAHDLKGKGGFTRLFIFEDFSSIRREHLSLMEENYENAVEVLIALAEDVNRTLDNYGWQQRGDFGLWDDRYLITIISKSSGDRQMEVSTDEKLLDTARLLVKELTEVAWSWTKFEAELVVPVNEKHWSTKPERLVDLEPPNGPAKADCETMWGAAFDVLRPGDRVALYGLTKSLIASLAEAITRHANMAIGCDIVDSRAYRNEPPHQGTLYVDKNWLEWEPDVKYRVVFGDDVIPNLGVWQVPLFFEKLAKAIPPGGRFITRTAAIFSSSVSHPHFDEALNKLRVFDPQNLSHVEGIGLDDLTEGVVYEVAWPALHSSEFFDQNGCRIDVGNWDRKLSRETDNSDFKAKVELPYKQIVTALDSGQLEEFSAPYFRIIDEKDVYSVWGNTPQLQVHPQADTVINRFRDYYRILVFERV